MLRKLETIQGQLWAVSGLGVAVATALLGLVVTGVAWSQTTTPPGAPPRTTPDAKDAAKDTAKDARDAARDATKDAKDTARDAAKDARDTIDDARKGNSNPQRDARDARDRDLRDTRDARDRDARDNRDARERDARDNARDPRDIRDTRDARDSRDRIGDRDDRGSQQFRASDVRSADIGLWFNRGGNDGLVISDVSTKGAIAKFGFRDGDRIVSVNGRTVAREADFVNYLFADDVRDTRVKVIVTRDGREETILVEPSVLIEEYSTIDHDPLEHFGVIVDDRYTDRIVVWRVVPRSPAYYAGIRAGDVFTQFHGKPVNAVQDIITGVRNLAEGAVNVRVMRDKTPRDFSVDVPRYNARSSRYTTYRPNIDVNVERPNQRREERIEDRRERRIETRGTDQRPELPRNNINPSPTDPGPALPKTSVGPSNPGRPGTAPGVAPTR